MLDSISINRSFIPLSTCVTFLGEIENRILTPFGILDIVYKPIQQMDGQTAQFEIGLTSDSESRVLFDEAFGEFKKTVQDLLWGMAQRYFGEDAIADVEELSIYIKGFETRLSLATDARTESHHGRPDYD